MLLLCGAQGALGQGQLVAQQESPGDFDATGIGTGTRPISGLWQFHLGDNSAWAQPGFDDSGWERLPADQPWGDLGHPRVWGYAWYRREITLDPKSKEPLGLLLPPLDSAAEVYWNGVKIGGEGSMPPHPSWFKIQQPVAIPLPPPTGASTGVLAVRIWAYYREEADPPDVTGLQGPLLLGYRPLIQKMPQGWAEHRESTQMVANVVTLLCAFVGIAALVLWTQIRSQWVLLWVGLFFGGYAVSSLVINHLLSLPWIWVTQVGGLVTTFCGLASMFLILFIADLPHRPGVRGFRFWFYVCVAVSCITLLQQMQGELHDAGFIPSQFVPPGADPGVLVKSFAFVATTYNYAFSLFLLALLAVCLILSRRTLARVLFMGAVALYTALQFVSFVAMDDTSRLAPLKPFLHRPVLRISGSPMSLFTATRFLVVLAVVYAVWDQISKQVARQRFVDAEMKAAQEIQQVLVPAAAEREAPGFAVSSVYRPASEVGGDFFQIIPLQDDGTLIVAGDVSGKGLRAAMTVSLVVGALRTLAEYDSSPAAVLTGLNRRLLGRTQGGFVTCCAVRVVASGRAIMANAGHCQPYLDGREVELPGGLPLGIVADAEYQELEVNVQEGQQLTLLSDGVVEARNPQGELFGFDRLNDLMQQRPTAEHVAETAMGFGQDDDITVLMVTRLATG